MPEAQRQLAPQQVEQQPRADRERPRERHREAERRAVPRALGARGEAPPRRRPACGRRARPASRGEGSRRSSPAERRPRRRLGRARRALAHVRLDATRLGRVLERTGRGERQPVVNVPAHRHSAAVGARQQPLAQPGERAVEASLGRRQRHARACRRSPAARAPPRSAGRAPRGRAGRGRRPPRPTRALRWRASAWASGSAAGPPAPAGSCARLVEALGPAAAQLVEREVAGDREEPRPERPRRVVAADALGRVQPRLLEHVLGHGLVSQEPQQVAEEAVLVAAHQPRETRRVAPAEPCGVLAVAIHRPSRSLRLCLLPVRASRVERTRPMGRDRVHLTLRLAPCYFSPPAETVQGPEPARMTNAADDRTVKLDVASRFEMLDVVQTVLVQLCAIVGFDDEAQHYMSVAVRESVVNAIKHGNRQDEAKRVHVQFTVHDRALEVEVRDEGRGFDPAGGARPARAREPAEGLRPRHLLHAAVHGRGHALVPAQGRHRRPHAEARPRRVAASRRGRAAALGRLSTRSSAFSSHAGRERVHLERAHRLEAPLLRRPRQHQRRPARRRPSGSPSRPRPRAPCRRCRSSRPSTPCATRPTRAPAGPWRRRRARGPTRGGRRSAARRTATSSSRPAAPIRSSRSAPAGSGPTRREKKKATITAQKPSGIAERQSGSPSAEERGRRARRRAPRARGRRARPRGRRGRSRACRAPGRAGRRGGRRGSRAAARTAGCSRAASSRRGRRTRGGRASQSSTKRSARDSRGDVRQTAGTVSPLHGNRPASSTGT